MTINIVNKAKIDNALKTAKKSSKTSLNVFKNDPNKFL